MPRLPMFFAAALLLAACSDPVQEPLPEPSPDPQATTSAEATELRDAIQAPIDKARAVEDTQAADETERQDALENAGG
jgi:PBP1b-binding outer membrane lipoprotein LpoB